MLPLSFRHVNTAFLSHLQDGTIHAILPPDAGMCARYKADPESKPGREPRHGRRVYGQAPPRPRIQPNLPPEEELFDDDDGLRDSPITREAPPSLEDERLLLREAPAGRVRASRRPVALPPLHTRLEDGEDDPLQRTERGESLLCDDSNDAFGSPAPPRRYTRHLAENDERPPWDGERPPWEDLRRPPRQGTSVWKALWLLFSFPFRTIGFLTRTLPRLVLWPLRLLISCAFVGLIFLILLAIIYGIKAGRYDITQILRMPERTIVLDRKGNEIGTLHGENRRSITDLDSEVPRYFIDALIMQEDRSFWKHGGVDPRGVLRAVGQVFKHHRTTQGASTLTMQLAKNTYNHRERNFDAKLTETALARRIEATYDKKTILTCYINRVFWGHTFLGLKQAAYGYFNKYPRDLTLGEAALLAGIVCSPNEFSPYRNPSAARIQRDKVLKLLHDHGYITRKQYEAALAEAIVTCRPKRRGNDNYALDLIRSEVDHVLSLLDSQDQRLKEEAIYSGGLIVRTTLDVDLQDDVMKEMDSRLVELLEKNRRYPHQTREQFRAHVARLSPEEADRTRPQYVQAACVIIDNATGALLAVVGGRDSTESPLNRAVQSRRQVGSLFKPIVYATFFERGGSPNTLISDDRLLPGEIPGARRWNPGNADGRFRGMNPASWGLLRSRNTMSVRVGNRAGLSHVVNAARMAGFPQPLRPPGPTIYLGTWEASPLEVAAAYTIFANGGVRPTPYIIESITDTRGHVLWRNQASARRVFSPRTTQLISGILQQITKPGGTAGNMQRLGFTAPCGGKTGTTNRYKNAWFCGFTSDLTAAVWVGFDRPRTIKEKAYGGTLALPLWVGAMQKAAARGYAMGDIRTRPAGTRRTGMRLCRESGMLAHSGCEYMGRAYTETMADFNKPRALCTLHDPLAEDPDESSDELAEDPDEVPADLPADDVAEDPNAPPDIDDTAEEVP